MTSRLNHLYLWIFLCSKYPFIICNPNVLHILISRLPLSFTFSSPKFPTTGCPFLRPVQPLKSPKSIISLFLLIVLNVVIKSLTNSSYTIFFKIVCWCVHCYYCKSLASYFQLQFHNSSTDLFPALYVLLIFFVYEDGHSSFCSFLLGDSTIK